MALSQIKESHELCQTRQIKGHASILSRILTFEFDLENDTYNLANILLNIPILLSLFFYFTL